MKKYIIMLVVLVSCGLSAPVNAQVRVGVNIGIQPVWGPVGYDHVDYYYFPDIDVYYNVPLAQYTWFDDGRWVTTPGLPPRYRDFDLYHSYKVVLNERNPWLRHDVYHNRYAQYRGRHDQAIIRESHDERYFVNPNHPDHGRYHGEGRGDERHEDHGRGEHHEDHHDGDRR